MSTVKTLTLTSEFFQNECSESFCKAIQGNECKCYYGHVELIGFYAKRFTIGYLKTEWGYYENSPTIEFVDSITFKLDDSFSVDLPCLQNFGMLRKHMGNLEISQIEIIRNDALKYLATLQGVIIEEAGE